MIAQQGLLVDRLVFGGLALGDIDDDAGQALNIAGVIKHGDTAVEEPMD